MKIQLNVQNVCLQSHFPKPSRGPDWSLCLANFNLAFLTLSSKLLNMSGLADIVISNQIVLLFTPLLFLESHVKTFSVTCVITNKNCDRTNVQCTI